MNLKIYSLVIASAAILTPQVATASLLLAIDDFSVPTNPIVTSSPGNYVAPGFTATLTGKKFVTGGSNDGTFGDQAVPPAIAEASNGGLWLVDSDFRSATMTLAASGGSSAITGLLFDAATSAGLQNLEISYQINGSGLPAVSNFIPKDINNIGVGYSGDFGDYFLPLNFMLGGSDSVVFTFRSVGFAPQDGDSIYIDNFAVIPEPGSFLALGCLMGCGAFLRSRCRRA